MKKLFLVLIASLLVLTGCSTGGGKASGTLTVANGAAMDGDFIAGFSNSSYDADGINLIWGLATYRYDAELGALTPDMSVLDAEPTTETDAAGNKTYTMKIKKGLKFSDGTEVTAKDYVVSLLFQALPQWLEVAKIASEGYELLGYGAYSTGEAAVFEGVKLIDETTFSVTIDAANLPYYYETINATIAPVPTHVWFKDATINETGNGFTNTAEEIAAAVKYVAETERFAPSVVTGPYVLESFTNKIATFKANENYSGDYEGKKAQIETIIVKEVADNLLVDAVKNGEVDFAPSIMTGSDIQKALDAGLKYHSYPRSGYGKIALMTDIAPTNDKYVRQGIAWVVDRSKFVEALTSGYGKVVDGPYGLSMPQYAAKADDISSRIHQYTYNLEKANEVLNQSPYIYEADGTTPFDPAKASETGSYFRHNAEGAVLEIKHYATVEAASVSDLILSSVPPAAAAVGMKYTVTMGDWATFGAMLYDEIENDYNAFNYASSYPSFVYDPYTAFHSKFATPGGSNTNQVKDAELDKAIEAMRGANPGDVEAYNTAFADYIVQWNDLIPEIPLYSNQIHDIMTERVEGADNITPIYNWAKAVLDLSVKN